MVIGRGSRLIRWLPIWPLFQILTGPVHLWVILDILGGYPEVRSRVINRSQIQLKRIKKTLFFASGMLPPKLWHIIGCLAFSEFFSANNKILPRLNHFLKIQRKSIFWFFLKYWPKVIIFFFRIEIWRFFFKSVFRTTFWPQKVLYRKIRKNAFLWHLWH